MAVVPGTASAAVPVPLSGAFDGWGDASALTQFGTWRGAAPTVVEDYLGFDQWSTIAYPNTLLSDWSAFHNAGNQLVLSVPMLVSGSQGSFADGAAGAYDQTFLSMGRTLVSQGYGSAVLRLGWEFDQTWSPWSIQPNSATMGPAAFVAYWRHLVDLLRSIPGANFKFDWTVTPGGTAFAPADAYPGNGYVDYVGLDIYDRGWAADGGPIADPAARWQQLTTQPEGLNYWASFASQQGKQLAVGEWGLWNDLSSNGGGDDPYFIDQMYHWFQANNVAYECYFNADSNVITGGAAPQAAAEYQKLWGGSGATGSTGTTGAGTTTTGSAGGTGGGTTTTSAPTSTGGGTTSGAGGTSTTTPVSTGTGATSSGTSTSPVSSSSSGTSTASGSGAPAGTGTTTSSGSTTTSSGTSGTVASTGTSTSSSGSTSTTSGSGTSGTTTTKAGSGHKHSSGTTTSTTTKSGTASAASLFTTTAKGTSTKSRQLHRANASVARKRAHQKLVAKRRAQRRHAGRGHA